MWPRVRGRFITFEGIDGSGKTTIVHRIEPEFRKRGYTVVLTSEPTRTWLGDAVRKSYEDDVGPVAETFLFLADRARHTDEIRTWLRAGAIVVSDRYADSTYAYQGARLEGIVKDPIRWLQRVSAPAVLGGRPASRDPAPPRRSPGMRSRSSPDAWTCGAVALRALRDERPREEGRHRRVPLLDLDQERATERALRLDGGGRGGHGAAVDSSWET